MKKLLRIFIVAFTLIATSYVFTSCDKEDDDEYYAGESEEDFRPNVYTIESTWDFTKVENLSSEQKSELSSKLSSEINGSKTFDTRAAAVVAFDNSIEELRHAEAPAGLKGTITLKRGTAIIKRANLQW